jgi:hypothetical protein
MEGADSVAIAISSSPDLKVLFLTNGPKRSRSTLWRRSSSVRGAGGDDEGHRAQRAVPGDDFLFVAALYVLLARAFLAVIQISSTPAASSCSTCSWSCS